MTQFAEEVRNSNALAHLAECKQILADLESVTWDTSAKHELVSRIRVAVDDVHRRMIMADLDLIPRDLPSTLEPHTQSLLEFVQLLRDSGPEGNFNITVGHQRVDSVLGHATSLPSLSSPDESLERAAEQFSRTAIQAKEDIEKAIDDAKAQFEDLSRQITEKGNDFDSVSAGHKSTFDARSAEFETRVQDLTSRVSQATERIGREVTSIQETFRQSQGTRDEEFQQAQTSRNEEFHQRLDETVAQVESYRDQARSMLEEVAGASTAEHYARQHSVQRLEADKWRQYSLYAFGAILLVSVAMFVDARLSDAELSAVWVLARSPVLLALAASAGFSVRQSANHRRREEEMARVANELQLLWPFVNRLPESDRQELLREVSPLYFKGGLSTNDGMQQGTGKLKGMRNTDSQRDSTTSKQ